MPKQILSGRRNLQLYEWRPVEPPGECVLCKGRYHVKLYCPCCGRRYLALRAGPMERAVQPKSPKKTRPPKRRVKSSREGTRVLTSKGEQIIRLPRQRGADRVKAVVRGALRLAHEELTKGERAQLPPRKRPPGRSGRSAPNQRGR